MLNACLDKQRTVICYHLNIKHINTCKACQLIPFNAIHNTIHAINSINCNEFNEFTAIHEPE